MPTEMLIILVLVILCIIFALSINVFNKTTEIVRYITPIEPTSYTDDLEHFEEYYLSTLSSKYMQKAEKIANPTRAFTNDGNMFQGLPPWSSPPDFGVA